MRTRNIAGCRRILLGRRQCGTKAVRVTRYDKWKESVSRETAIAIMSKTDELAESMLSLMLALANLFGAPYVLMVMWNWFVVPLGVVAIGYAWAFGLAAFGGLLKMRLAHANEPKSDTTQQIVYLFTMAVMLGMGWLAHKAMTL